ncbi:MAG: 4Fe-4S dicluster domain-containing protein [Smithellaceae bacterium]|nr:4Fe-4S dicluster domain-containing protein [Smithellaceae bacterium]
MLKKIEQGRLCELVAALLERGELYAPVRDDRGVNFQSIGESTEVTLDFYNTLLSPKSVFFPQSEDMIAYRLGKREPTALALPLPATPTVLLGVRPVDAKSFLLMDELFLGGGIPDPYWQARREQTTVIGYAFDPGAADPADFYSTLGIGSADTRGSDILLAKGGDDYLLQGITAKGEALLSALTVLAETSPGEETQFAALLAPEASSKTRHLALDPGKVAKRLEDLFADSAFWEGISAACISCGTCTFVCPTCHCFDIADETLFREGVRRRFWDACMFTDFTLEASGHNPRKAVYQRLRQKVCHKYSYYVRKLGVISCVGCGRCTRSCPVNIDIFSIIAQAMNRN